VTSLAAIVLTTTIYFTARMLAPHLEEGLLSFLDAAAVAVLVLALVPGQAWLRTKIDQVLFRRRTRRRLDAMVAFLHTLSPELGVRECCRRAIGEFVTVMQLRGAATLLASEEEPIVGGEVDLGQIPQLWPRQRETADRRFPLGFGTLEMLELPAPLREALSEADVTGVFPVTSPHRQWGHVLMSAGLLRMVITDEDADVIRAFSSQLGLLLDGADLLARAVAVERSLAHAEKLAAIGETAARIAHEIRNPVTAARSLAQQLAREPGSPFATEHTLILEELERIERQVAALLRFSRREDFRFEPVDLGELVRATLAQYEPRLAAAGVEVGLELPGGVTPLADREKLRQVLVNLVENALDALRVAPERRLLLAVGTDNGSATLSIRDSGAGVPAEARPRLFEPFFSLKDGGTGLGLAIAKRTVEAHGGQIEADTGLGTGMGFRVALPLAAAGHSSPPRGTSGSGSAGGRTS
jgi:signal transduction histidine kinase